MRLRWPALSVRLGLGLFVLICLAHLPCVARASEQVGSRFVYLDERDPYYPHLGFPKLITPMWVGEQGVEAVVILSIDDMGRTPHYPGAATSDEYARFLAPIADRLRRID